MLNALPLPAGPPDLSGGALKAERTPSQSNGCAEETGDSFASTLDSACRREKAADGKSHLRGATESAEEPQTERKASPKSGSDPDVTADQEALAAVGQARPADAAAPAKIDGEAPVAPPVDAAENETPTNPSVPSKASADGVPPNGLGKHLAADGDGTVEPVSQSLEKGAAGLKQPAAAGEGDAPRVPTDAEPESSLGGPKAETPEEARKETGKRAPAETGSRVPDDAAADKAGKWGDRKGAPAETGSRVPGDAAADKAGKWGETALQADQAARQTDVPSGERLFGKDRRQTTDPPKAGAAAAADPKAEGVQRGSQASERSDVFPRPVTDGDRAAEPGQALGDTSAAAMKDESGPTANRPAGPDGSFSFAASQTGGKASTVAAGSTGATPPSPAAADAFVHDNFNQLVERALFSVRGGQSEARIALKPDHLGHVRMQIVTESHAVSIKIIAESAATRDLIDANAHQLRSELQQQGLNVQSIQVSVSNGDQDPYRGARQREAFLRHMAAGEPFTDEEDVPASAPGRPLRSAGLRRAAGIDYFA